MSSHLIKTPVIGGGPPSSGTTSFELNSPFLQSPSSQTRSYPEVLSGHECWGDAVHSGAAATHTCVNQTLRMDGETAIVVNSPTLLTHRNPGRHCGILIPSLKLLGTKSGDHLRFHTFPALDPNVTLDHVAFSPMLSPWGNKKRPPIQDHLCLAAGRKGKHKRTFRICFF